MERGEGGTDSLKETLDGVARLEIRHDRRGWLQEACCCITKSDFAYYDGEKKIAESKEEFEYLCRCCCAPHHPFDMTVKAAGSDSELIEFNRPCRLPLCACKCCCFQEGTVFSGEDDLGEVRETFWWFVPQWKVYDDDNNALYKIHPPTCMGGMCINCCVEGHCCPFGCCLIPCMIYPVDQWNTDGNAPYLGRMAKIPKENFCDVYNETSYVEIQFPEGATPKQKGLLLGSYLLINALFFENSE